MNDMSFTIRRDFSITSRYFCIDEGFVYIAQQDMFVVVASVACEIHQTQHDSHNLMCVFNCQLKEKLIYVKMNQIQQAHYNFKACTC